MILKEIKRIFRMTKKVTKEKGICQVFNLGLRMIISRTSKHIAYLSYLFRSRLLKKKFIHVIGDSHVGAFNKNKHFFKHHIPHATAHNLCKKKSTSNSNEEFWKIINKINRTRDTIILVFGEIDCRIHIYYQYRKRNMKESVNNLIDKTIGNYDIILNRLRELNIDFFIYGIPPASKEENIYNKTYYATEAVRAKISKRFNDKLKNYCRDRGYKYINIYPEICDEEGFVKKKYSLDGVHLNKKIANFVKNYIGKN